MQHPFEPVVSIIRKLTDTEYAGCRLFDDILAAAPRATGWFEAYQADKKLPPDAIQFIAKTAALRSRLARSVTKGRSPLLTAKGWPDAKKAISAAVMTATSVVVGYPFLVAYCTAATVNARFPSMLPFRGNIGTWRGLLANGSILSLWKGCVPMVVANVINDFTSRLRLGKLATLVATLVEYAFEVVSIRMMCWDTRLAAGWTSVGPATNFATGYIFKLAVECTGIGYYLPLSVRSLHAGPRAPKRRRAVPIGRQGSRHLCANSSNSADNKCSDPK